MVFMVNLASLVSVFNRLKRARIFVAGTIAEAGNRDFSGGPALAPVKKAASAFFKALAASCGARG
jgi:hypothetical protein